MCYICMRNAQTLATQVPLPKSSINPDDPVEVLRGVSAELDRMQALVNKEVGRHRSVESLDYKLTFLLFLCKVAASSGLDSAQLSISHSLQVQRRGFLGTRSCRQD